MTAANISALAIFIEGLLSFFSPCVLPLVPLYMTYLSSDAKTLDEKGGIHYKTTKVLLTTVFFVGGIALTFFILGLSLAWLKNYIEAYRHVIGLVGGTIIIIFALSQIGLFTISFKEWHLPLKLDVSKMNYLKAFLMGFIFSFAWTPCVGPMLANVLFLAMGADAFWGNIYLLVYALGFIIPFLLLGIFTGRFLNFIKSHHRLFAYTLKLAGIIMLCFGIYMLYDNANAIVAKEENVSVRSDDYFYLSDYSLKDQDGNIHDLSAYEGEYVMLNFVATWCTYCRQEIPEYENFLKAEGINGFYVMAPSINGGSVEDIQAFFEENDMEMPILVDEEAGLFQNLGIASFPHMVIMGPDGSYVGYVTGAMNHEQFAEVFKRAQEIYEKR